MNNNQSALSNVLASVFSYGNRNVRTVMINNEPWFVAKDVCEVLEISNTTQAVSRLDEDEVTMFNIGAYLVIQISLMNMGCILLF